MVQLDDGWAAAPSGGLPNSARDANGGILPDPAKFPSGMPTLSAYVHGLGLKFGIYSSSSAFTCFAKTGSLWHEYQDAATFASWGADNLKYDTTCQSYFNQLEMMKYGPPVANRYYVQYMGQALEASGRAISYEPTLDEFSEGQNWIHLTGANSSLLTWDMQSSYARMSRRFELPWNPHVGPGYFDDMDMMPFGPWSMTAAEERSMFSLWAIKASPLWIAADITTISDSSLGILLNTDVIAVDQDALGIQGQRVSQVACGAQTCEVWAKPLAGGACAIAFFNRDTAAHDITATFATVASVVPACGTGPYTATRDLWAHSSLGTLTTGYTAPALASHDVAVIRVAP